MHVFVICKQCKWARVLTGGRRKKGLACNKDIKGPVNLQARRVGRTPGLCHISQTDLKIFLNHLETKILRNFAADRRVRRRLGSGFRGGWAWERPVCVQASATPLSWIERALVRPRP